MAQKISRGSILGRIGTGVGEGLAEQLPKEMDRSRLSSGLKQFEQDASGLSPMQQIARLSAIPGVTPQMIDSMSKFAMQNREENAYRNGNGGFGAPPTQEQPSSAMPQPAPGMPSNQGQPVSQPAQQNAPNGALPQRAEQQQQQSKKNPNVSPEESGQKGIVNTSLVSENALPKIPWSPQQRNESIRQYVGQGFTAQQAKDLTADDESRYLESASAYEARDEALKKKQKEARSELDRQLVTKMQKTSSEVANELSGPILINLQRGMERDIRNTDRTLEDIANDWSNRGLALAEAKTSLETLAHTTGIESIGKETEVWDKLKSYSKIFNKAGSSKQFVNILQKDMNLSPQSSSLIGYPPSKDVESYIKKLKNPQAKPWQMGYEAPERATKKPWEPGYKPPTSRKIMTPEQAEDNSRKIARDISEKITTNDSLLGIARDLSNRDPSFDQRAFFNQLREIADELPLNDRQELELARGEPDIVPTWGDLLVFPIGHNL